MNVLYATGVFCAGTVFFFAVADLLTETDLIAGFLFAAVALVADLLVFFVVADFVAETGLSTGFLFIAARCACF